MKSLPTMTRKQNFNPGVNSYPTKDGRWLMLVMLQTDRYWAEFCARIGRPELATDPRYRDMKVRFENREACIAELDAVFTSRTLDEWREALDGMEGPWAPVQKARELLTDRQSARERLRAGGGRRQARPLPPRHEPGAVRRDAARRSRAAPSGASTPTRCSRASSASRWTSCSSTRRRA